MSMSEFIAIGYPRVGFQTHESLPFCLDITVFSEQSGRRFVCVLQIAEVRFRLIYANDLFCCRGSLSSVQHRRTFLAAASSKVHNLAEYFFRSGRLKKRVLHTALSGCRSSPIFVIQV